MSNTNQTLALARFSALKKMPYMATAVRALIMVPTERVETLAVSVNWVCYYNEAFVLQQGCELIGGVLLHEANHLLRLHATRRGSRDAVRWNVAADMAINHDLQEAFVQLPEGGIYPETYGLPTGKSADWYYDNLPEEVADPKCGSAAGNSQPCEGDVPEGTPMRDDVDTEMISRAVAGEIKAHSAKHAGAVPAGMRLWADEQLAPAQVPWNKILARAVRRNLEFARGCTDYTYRRPSRRQLSLGVRGPRLPSMHAPVPKLVVGVDTSGSMMGEPLQIAAQEVIGIIRATGAPVEFIAVDCEAYPMGKVRSAKDFARAFRGGGGTSFDPFFETIAQRRLRPSMAIFLTDGYGHAPEKAPTAYETVWVAVGRDSRFPADWGIQLQVDEAKK